jgi:hypothetical protein
MTDSAGGGDVKEKILYLMLAPPENINQMNVVVVKNILKRGCIPLVISINLPYKVLARIYTKEGIDPEKYYVVDAVTLYSGGVCEPHPHVKYVTNPSNLTDLGIAVTEMLKRIPEPDKCIVFDSVSMLLIHIPSVTTSKFLHFVVNKLKLSDVAGIFLCVEQGLDPLVMSQMRAFVDKIIDYTLNEKSGR